MTFDTEGFFVYKCQPHLGLGVVGLIQDAPVSLNQVEVD